MMNMHFFYQIMSGITYKFHRLMNIVRTRFVLVGNGVQFKNYRIVGVPFVEVRGGGRIVFGDNLGMNNGMKANQIGYNTPCVFRAEGGGSIIIGDNVGISQTVLIAQHADIIVGNNVKLGGGVKVYTSDFHCKDYLMRRDWKSDKRERLCAPITIEDDCFIGAGTIILKGVTIGPRSIIGAGSVVTKNIPSDCIAGGNPCRVIKQLDK